MLSYTNAGLIPMPTFRAGSTYLAHCSSSTTAGLVPVPTLQLVQHVFLNAVLADLKLPCPFGAHMQ
jgi:hypothetical protein